MRSIREKFDLLRTGKMKTSVFLENARQTFPDIINGMNNFEDTVEILVQKKFLTEANKKEADLIKRADYVNFYELEKGIYFEMKNPPEVWKADGLGKFFFDEKDYLQAKEKAVKNLEKNPKYYSDKEEGKTGRTKKRTDKEIEIKGKNFKDTDNEMKVIKENKSLNDIIDSYE